MLISTEDSSALVSSSSGHLLLYDGECGFCDRLVQWLLVKDKKGMIQYAPLQGPTARAIFARHPELPPDLDSLVYVTGSGPDERVYFESRGAFRLFRDLGYPIAFLAWPAILPRFLTDLGYRLFARTRYRVFGRLDTCRVPTPSERSRFLP